MQRRSNRLPVTKNKNTGNPTTAPHASRGPDAAKGGGLPKEPTAFIGKIAGKETERKTKKERNMTEQD